MAIQLTRAEAGHLAPPRPVVASGGLVALLSTLFKLRIGVAIMLSGMAGALVAAGSWPSLGDLGVLAISILVAAAGAGACNHYFERDIDVMMGRTRGRPFVTGRLSASPLWPAGFLTMIAGGGGLAWAWFDLLTGSMVVAGALTYAVVYTLWLKRRTHWNIVVGGLAGSFAVLAGGASQGRFADPAVLWLAVVLFLWTPSHFWSLAIAMAEDYRRAGVPMLPVTHGAGTAARWNLVNAFALGAAAVALAVIIRHPAVWFAVAVGCGYLISSTLQMVRCPEVPVALRAFRASLVQLGLLLVSIFAATPGA